MGSYLLDPAQWEAIETGLLIFVFCLGFFVAVRL